MAKKTVEEQIIEIYHSLSASLLKRNLSLTVDSVLKKIKLVFNAKDAYLFFIDRGVVETVYADFETKSLKIPVSIDVNEVAIKEAPNPQKKLSIHLDISDDVCQTFLGNQYVDNQLSAVFFSFGNPIIIMQVMNLTSIGSAYYRYLKEITYLLGPIFLVFKKVDSFNIVTKEKTRKLSAEVSRYEEFWYNSQDPMILCKINGELERWNPAAEKLLTITVNGKQRIFNLKERFYHPEDFNVLLSILKRNGVVQDFEVLIHNKNYEREIELGHLEEEDEIHGLTDMAMDKEDLEALKSIIYSSASVSTINDEKGNINALIIVLKDVTERMAYSSQLWSANMRLFDLNSKLKNQQSQMVQQEKLASIGNLAAGIAHEINNPLSFVKSNHSSMKRIFDTLIEALDKLLEDSKYSDQKESLKQLIKDSNEIMDESDEGFSRIMTIIQGLKDFSRIDAMGKISVVDLNRSVETTLLVARNQYRYIADIAVHYANDVQIECISDQINQVLLNIIVNAAQAIKEEDREDMGTIEISLEKTSQQTVRITISDDGPGIPDHIKSDIFDPFFTTKDVGEGTGLGLSISRDIIVSKHKGTMKVENNDPKGTKFILEVPVKYLSSQESTPKEPAGDSKDSMNSTDKFFQSELEKVASAENDSLNEEDTIDLLNSI